MMNVRRAFVAASAAAVFGVVCLPAIMMGQDPVRTVTLVPVADFGKGVNWVKIFPDYQGRGTYKDLVRLSDGRFIVADSRTYNFLVFSADGKLLKKFWKRGRRDKENLSVYGRPDWISIWEDKLLFVSELGRIRVFDLSGKEIRSAKVDHPVTCFEALDEKTVAVAGWVLRKDLPNLHLVAVVDLDSEKETIVMDMSSKEFDKPAASYTTDEGLTVTFELPFATLRPFVRRLSDGRFLAGFSHWPEVAVHDITGGKAADFLLKTPKNKNDLAFYEGLDRILVETRGKITTYSSAESGVSLRPRGGAAIVLPRRLSPTMPYYYNLNVEAAGKLRVFLLPEKGKNPVVQVYTPAGELIDQHAIDEGEYRLVLSPGAQGPIFAGEFVYALAEKKDAKGVPLRLMKFRLVDK